MKNLSFDSQSAAEAWTRQPPNTIWALLLCQYSQSKTALMQNMVHKEQCG